MVVMVNLRFVVIVCLFFCIAYYFAFLVNVSFHSNFLVKSNEFASYSRMKLVKLLQTVQCEAMLHILAVRYTLFCY